MPDSSSALIPSLTEICGREFVLTDPHQLATYRPDGLLHHGPLRVAAVLPADTAQVAQVVRACYEARVPFVARGSGTGLSGGALPTQDGGVIGLSRHGG